MCSTHEVICLICEKVLAWWSMFDNIQYDDEYACSAAIKEDTNELIMDKVVQDKKHFDKLDDIIKEKKLEKIRNNTCVRRYWTYCHIQNDTYFCKKCAKKLNYKCPVCGGTIWKNRSH